MSVLDWAGTLLVALVLLATATALATAGRTWRTASDTRRSPPRSRPILTACVLVAVVIVTAGIASLSRAKTHLSAVQHDLAALQALARDGPAAIVPMQPGELLAQTHEDLARIQAAYAIPLSVAPHMGWVPYYGADIQAAPTLLQMGLDLTSTGQHLVDALSPLLKSDNGGMKGPDELVLVLETAHPALVEAQATLAQVHTVRQSMDVDGLSPRMTGWLTQLDGTLPLIQGGVHGLLALPELLGASEPRAILVLIQNEDELRATGGFISGVARVVVDRGRIVELVFEDSYAIDDFSLPYPIAPQPFREIMGPVPWVFRDANWSPDFPTSAQMASTLYGLRTHVPIHAVVAIDQQAVQTLMEALGPLTVPEYPEPITSDNVVQAMRESWAPSLIEEGLASEWWRHRKAFMGQLLTALANQLQDGVGDIDVMRLGFAILRALEERHVFVSLSDSESAAALRPTGWDGALRDVPGDFLMVADTNLGFNKVNPNIVQRVTYHVDLRDPEHPQATLMLDHRNVSSDTGMECRHEARYDLTYEQMMQRCYWDYVRVLAPAGSRLVEATPHPVSDTLLLTGVARPGDAQILPEEAGRSVFATFFVLAPGERVETRLVYDLPPDVIELEEGGLHYRLTVQKQGGTTANEVRVSVALPTGSTSVRFSPVSGVEEHGVVSFDLRLQTDVELEISAQRR